MAEVNTDVPAKQPSECKHENFRANVAVNRVLKNPTDAMPSGYMADITVCCMECGTPFEFVGVNDCGLMWDRPCVDPSAQELRIPLRPKGTKLLPGMPGFVAYAS